MLRVEDLSVAYGSVRALDGVSLEVKESGVLHGIIGPNGAGKSTLMDAITGRRKPTRGRVFVEGRDITALSVARRRRLGMSRSFQRTSIFPGLRETSPHWSSSMTSMRFFASATQSRRSTWDASSPMARPPTCARTRA
jgi:ABC-type branched-subunit amino acid transport system ATPase component